MTSMEPKGAIPVQVPKRKRFFLWLLTFLVFVGLFIALFWLSQRPSRGSITVVEPAAEPDRSVSEKRKQYQGKYFTFSYAYGFRRRDETGTLQYPMLDRVILSQNDIEGRKIVLVYQENADNTLETFGAFVIRRMDTATYAEEKIERSGSRVTLFTKAASVFEVGAFLTNNGRVLSVVATSPTTPDGLREEVLAVIDSLDWKVAEK